MKRLILTLSLLVTGMAAGFDHSHAAFNGLLKQHVRGGLVDYAGLKKNPAALSGYLAETAAVAKGDFKAWSRDQRLAFLINVYNAATLQAILTNYPLKSIKDINGGKGPWKDANIPLLGKTTSLDAIENEMIRPEFKEPRIHFALVCAAIGCPPLRPEAYVAEKLDAQLADQTKVFLADKGKNRSDGGTLYLSPIFDWYGKDFSGDPAVWVRPWLGAGDRVKFTDYDWSLNRQ